MLEIRGARCRINRRELLEVESFAIRPGERWAVFGGNGSGKSLLADLLGGRRRESGSYVVARDGFDLRRDVLYVSLAEQQRLRARDRRRDISEHSDSAHDAGTSVAALIRQSRGGAEQDEDFLGKLLAALGLTAAREQGIRYVSSGQLRRAYIARALYAQCPGRARLLVFDDSLESLDRESRGAVARAIGELTRPGNASLCLARRWQDILPGTTHLAVMARLEGSPSRLRLLDQGTLAVMARRETVGALRDTAPALPAWLQGRGNPSAVARAAGPDIRAAGEDAAAVPPVGMRGRENPPAVVRAAEPNIRATGGEAAAVAPIGMWGCENPSVVARAAEPNIRAAGEDAAAVAPIWPRGLADPTAVARARAAERDVLVELRGVSARYGGRVVWRDLHWTLGKSDHVLVEGPNGCGKSTLLGLVNGDNHLGYGQPLTLFGRRKGSGETITAVKSRFGVVSNELHDRYGKGWRALEVVASGFFASLGLYDEVDSQRLERARTWLALVGMAGREGRYFHELSGGGQRLVLLARAMVTAPRVLMLDEPLLGLDDSHRRQILELLDRIAAHCLTQIIYVSHLEGEHPRCMNRQLRFEPVVGGGFRCVARAMVMV